VLILVEKNLGQHFFEHLLRTTETSRSPELLALLHAWSLSAAPTVRSLAPCQAKTPAPCTDQQNDQRKTKKQGLALLPKHACCCWFVPAVVDLPWLC